MKRKKSNKEDKLNLEAIMANVIKHNEKSEENIFIKDLRTIVSAARDTSYRMANIMQVLQNWLIGRRIVVQEQQGRARADYGKHIIELASLSLYEEFGRGFSETQVRNYRKFYLAFSNLLIQQTMPAESVSDGIVLPVQLSWSHYERLIRIADPKARMWYMQEAATQQWDYRTLKRNIDSQYYYRMLSSQVKEPVKQEMESLTEKYQKDKLEFIKNPMVVEFLGLTSDTSFTESKLESSIITHLQKFIMEMGKGYAFVARQQHIHTTKQDYYIDLVFYNYILKCFVLIDLKTSKITHQDVGQMDMYIRMYDELKRGEGDNPTLGIVLCSETDEDIARYSVLRGNEQLFASKYKLYLPNEELLRAEIESQKAIFQIQNGGF